ncbi:sulfatase-like hydrolase/transferase [Marinovum sp.]|uniref:sulfatase-like hydrolase/transferase n=1 Tax=Marinovum sp. TaxID=2024839 RepID=UPI002B278598|nr:sulfatase-like hydrolase/transferase [Marinovum sp.]
MKPNILYILSDQHAAHVAGCYGDPVVRTPNIDRLAARGVRFDNAYTPSPICLPARMSLLTGRYPCRQNVWTNSDSLASDLPTFAHAHGAAGYRPTLIGRLHSLGPDQLHGYAHREVGDHMTDWLGGSDYSLGVLDKCQRPFRDALVKSGPGRMSFEDLDKDVTRHALAFLDREAEKRARGHTDPFSLSLGYMLPHQPYVGDPGLFEYYHDRVSDPRLARDETQEPEYLAWWRKQTGMNDMTPAEERRAKAAYYALVETLDGEIGKVLDRLERHGLMQHTMIVYASDHGDQLGERDLWFKQTFYDQSAKVPLILSWPGKVPENQRRDHVVNLVDLTATLVDAVGHDPLPEADGRSLLGIAKDPKADWSNETFSEYCTDGMKAWTGGKKLLTRMVRQGRFKLNYFHDDRHQLFDLEADPDETHNLFDAPQYAEVRDQLLTRVLDGWDPTHITQTIDRGIARKRILEAWARQTEPPERFRWPTRADQNWLVEGPTS